jgi:peptide/nickel transport system ATP-binding protein
MIELKNVSVQFTTSSTKWFQKNLIKAVENVNLTIEKNSIVGLVGESGCGKSTLGRAILKLLPLSSGEIYVNGQNISNYTQKQMLPLRSKLQIIFQDPYSSLNSRMTIYEILTEGLFTHFSIRQEEARQKAIQTLERVSLKPEILDRYPHEFSGGQRQRIAIARVLILEPDFIVCDEISSALDVSNQAQLVNLLKEFKEKFQLSLLFISHDLNIISYLADTIAVMYLGKIVELGSKEEIVRNPRHPYTKALFSNIFELGDLHKKREILKGEIPGVIQKPKGCYFHTRCPIVKDICKEKEPEWKELSPNRFVSCHFAEK